MSASPAQLAANRANAQHSTGPRTPEGKAASARNALSHGMHASDDTLLASPNSPAAAYLADFTAEFAPNSPAEAALVRQLALCTARADLLDRALDAFPRLNQRRALIDCLQDQYDVFGPSAQLKDQPEWSAALRRYDGCDSAYPRDPDPSTDPDLAACTLVYSLTSPRYGKLLRQHAQAGRGFHAALHDLRGLQAARPKAAPSHASAPPDPQSIADLLQRGWQLTPPDGARSIAQDEPNLQPIPPRTDLDHPGAQNEANLVPGPSVAGRPAIPRNLEASDLPHAPAEVRNEPNSACTPPATSPPSSVAARQYEPIFAPTRPRSAGVLAMRPQSQAQPPDLALLDRLTQHTAKPSSEAEWLAIACRPPVGRLSVEDEIAAPRTLARNVSGRRSTPPVSARRRP